MWMNENVINNKHLISGGKVLRDIVDVIVLPKILLVTVIDNKNFVHVIKLNIKA